MNLNLQDKVYIVTGGASGIGEAVCRLIASEGGIAVIADRNGDKSKSLAEGIVSHQQQAIALQVELTDEEQCRQLIETVINKYSRLDGLVNNASTTGNVSLENGSVRRFQLSLQINLVHCYAIAQYALPFLKKTKGAIVNIGSKVSIKGQGGTSGYAAGKSAVNALTREWAVELLPYDIRVNAVVPAEVDTPQYSNWIQTQPDKDDKPEPVISHIPFENRFTKPEEIANTIVFLLSDQSSHTTGQILLVGDGYTHLDRILS